jgi:DNA-binding NtrC family response regulator
LRHRRALFLDEVQLLDPDSQQILLPLLELPLRRFGGLVGGARPLHGFLHVVLGTNVDVSGNRWEQHFRADLWYRMSKVHVHLPTLAERGAEVIYQHLQRAFAALHVADPEDVLEITALQRVIEHSWPGNLRELGSFAERAAYRPRGEKRKLTVEDLAWCGITGEGAAARPDEDDELAAAELERVMVALRNARWVQADAARALGISPWRLLRILKRHGVWDDVRQRAAGARVQRRRQAEEDVV